MSPDGATDLFGLLTDDVLTVSLAMTRIAMAFMILPVFSAEILPSLVKNAIFVSLSIFTIVLLPPVSMTSLSITDWILLFSKELFIGLSIGVFFGLFLWSFEAAGHIIDSQIGLSVALVHDPISGDQTTLLGTFIGRLASYVFISAGGLMYLAGILFESYALWPIQSVLPDLGLSGLDLLQDEFGRFLLLMLMVAAPMLIVVLTIDTMMGLLNRYVQQFNVFFLSMSLKMLASTTVLFLTVATIAGLIIRELTDHVSRFPEILRLILQ